MALLNPPAALLGRVNAIVGGRARRDEVTGLTGPLSIKAVISGTAAWETRDGCFPRGPSGCLVLHDWEEHSIEVDALQPVETYRNLDGPLIVTEIARTACLSPSCLPSPRASIRVHEQE